MRDTAYWFYVLYSLKDHKLYKGTCVDIGRRFLAHNAGKITSTRSRRPFILLYIRCFDTKHDALHYERFAKSLAGGSELRQLLVSQGLINSQGLLGSVG